MEPNVTAMAKEYMDAGYKWEVKKVTKPGETEPVIQMHLVPPPEVRDRQRREHADVMREYRRKGYITLPDDLAKATGIVHWNPKDSTQTEKVIAEMSRQD